MVYYTSTLLVVVQHTTSSGAATGRQSHELVIDCVQESLHGRSNQGVDGCSASHLQIAGYPPKFKARQAKGKSSSFSSVPRLWYYIDITVAYWSIWSKIAVQCLWHSAAEKSA